MKNQLFTLVILCLATILQANNKLPVDMPLYNGSLLNTTELRQSGQLQFLLENEIAKHPDWQSLINQKKMSVGLVSLSNVYNPEYASINGDHMMYAASLPKIAVLLAAMDAIDKGELQDTDDIRFDMWAMISKSNNAATTRMIDRVGFSKISKVLQDPNYMLYDKNATGGLWVGKRYAAAGKRNPDPLKGLSHAATVNQVLRFYKMLAYGELINQKRSEEMLEIMINPSLHHKFVNTLDRINPTAKVFRKSGSWQTFHSDSAIVWGEDGKKYILVALINDDSGEKICRDLVVCAEKVMTEMQPAVVINSSSK